jgi:hypothetical protein
MIYNSQTCSKGSEGIIKNRSIFFKEHVGIEEILEVLKRATKIPGRLEAGIPHI